MFGKKQNNYVEREDDLAVKLEDSLRVGSRIASIAVPVTAYIATSDKQSELESLSWIKRMIANAFYGGKISQLNEFNDYSAKGIGAGAALAGMYATDRVIEKIAPRNSIVRKITKPMAYFTLANLTNLVVHGAKSLEGLLIDTAVKTTDALQHIGQTGNASDSEYVVNTSIATLGTFAVVKAADTLLVKSGVIGASYKLGKELVKTVVAPFKWGYSFTLGKANDRYESRRISNGLARKAQKEHQKELAKIGSRNY